MSSRTRFVAIVCIAAAASAGCAAAGRDWLETTRGQFKTAVQEIKADLSVLDSDDDGLDAFAPADANHLRSARAEMNR